MTVEPKAEVRVRVPIEMAEAIETLAKLAAVPADHVVGVIIALYLMPMIRGQSADDQAAEDDPPAAAEDDTP